MDIMKRIQEREDGNTVLLLVGIAVAILVLAVIFTVGPIVGYNVQQSVTIPTGQGISDAAKAWNGVNNSGGAFTNGSSLWAQNTPMLAVAALIAIVGVIIAILMGVANNNQ